MTTTKNTLPYFFYMFNDLQPSIVNIILFYVTDYYSHMFLMNVFYLLIFNIVLVFTFVSK